MIWRVVMNGKGGLIEVRERWSYVDLLTATFLLDQEYIQGRLEAEKYGNS